MAEKTLQNFLSSLSDALENAESGSGSEKKNNQGIIQSYKDGVIKIQGLSGLKMNEIVEIEGVKSKALVMNLEQDAVFAIVLESSTEIREGLFVKATGQFLSIPVGDEIIGRVVDPLGTPLDGKGNYKHDKLSLIHI